MYAICGMALLDGDTGTWGEIMGNGRSIHSSGADQSRPRLIVVTRFSTENLPLTEMGRIPRIDRNPNNPLWVSGPFCHASGLRRATASSARKCCHLAGFGCMRGRMCRNN